MNFTLGEIIKDRFFLFRWQSFMFHDNVVYKTHTNKFGEEQFQLNVPKLFEI
jgi:hypothetical protein